MIIEDEGGWVFEVPTAKLVPVPPPRRRSAVDVTPPEAPPPDMAVMLGLQADPNTTTWRIYPTVEELSKGEPPT